LRSRVMGLAAASHFIVNVGITEAGPSAFSHVSLFRRSIKVDVLLLKHDLTDKGELLLCVCGLLCFLLCHCLPLLPVCIPSFRYLVLCHRRFSF
jgi:hypothetical protein